MMGIDPSADRDRRRLRASLRLCFPAEQADALAAVALAGEPDPVAALEPVVRLARISFTANRFRAPFKRGADGVLAPPLRPRLMLAARPALALALHLGLELDLQTLARLFHATVPEISAALQRGRQEVDPTHVSPCPEFLTQIGRYRDPSYDRIERLNLLQHLQSCERCQMALDHAQHSDEHLLSVIDQAEEQVGPIADTPTRSTSWLGPALLWGGVALLALLLVAGAVAGLRHILTHGQPPVPLVAASTAPSPFSGWMLQNSRTGDVEAVSLSSGVRRLLVPGDPSLPASVLISPDRQQLAQMTYSDAELGQTLRVYSIQGVQQREWTGLSKLGRYQLDGWLNDDELLVTRQPVQRDTESQVDFQQRMARDAALLAFDTHTGDQHVLLQAQVDAATAAPDSAHVAVERVASDGSVTLEIRPMQAERLGDPVASVAFMTFAPNESLVLWAPDSRRVVFWARRLVAGSTGGPSPTIEVMSLDGKTTAIFSAPSNAFGSLLSLSPDGRQVIYAEGEPGATSAPWAYWKVDLAGGSPVKLLDGGDFARIILARRTFPPVVDLGPQGSQSIALTVEQPFYLPQPVQASVETGVASYVTLAAGATGQDITPLFDQFTPEDLLAWLPPDALTDTSGSPPTNQKPFRAQSQPLPVPALTANSRVSPDGTKVLTVDEGTNLAMAVPLTGPAGATPQPAGPPGDPSWLPDSSGAIGVQQHTTGNGLVSRIAIYGDTGNDILSLIDLDPAKLGQSTSASYHAPILSPNGLRACYFVVDRGAVSLWVGSDNAPPTIAGNWTLPTNPKLDLRLVATWAGNDTLIFAEPSDWTSGFPRNVSLERVSFGANGLTRLDTLMRWDARGGEKGVALQELRLSPDGSRLALRLRRFTGTNLTTDRFDSITVMSATDLTQAVEIAKGTDGDGMSWSPDGAELAAFIKGKLLVSFSDGSQTQEFDIGDRVFAFPVWVRPNEIWYRALEAGGQVLHDTLHATR